MSALLLAAVPVALMACTFWVDHHVHKTGGTSVRATMRHLGAEGRAVNIPGWRLPAGTESWRQLVDGLGELRTNCTLPPLLFTLELHEGNGPNFATAVLGPLRRLRATRGACCRVVLTTRVREPLDHYISAFRWAVLPAEKSVTFHKWAPPSLQSVLLHRGAYGQWRRGSDYYASREWFASFSANESEQLLHTLPRDYDLVWPLDRHADGMRALAGLLGIPPAELVNASEAVGIWSPLTGRTKGGLTGAAKAADIATNRTCGERGAEGCAPIVRTLGKYDEILYRYATERFARLGGKWRHPTRRARAPRVQPACVDSTRHAPTDAVRDQFAQLVRLLARVWGREHRGMPEMLAGLCTRCPARCVHAMLAGEPVAGLRLLH